MSFKQIAFNSFLVVSNNFMIISSNYVLRIFWKTISKGLIIYKIKTNDNRWNLKSFGKHWTILCIIIKRSDNNDNVDQID